MNTLEFLELVTPAQGQKAIVVPRGINETSKQPNWFHYAYDTQAEAASCIAGLEDRHIYFALGGFKPNAIERYRGRKQENVDYLRSFWLDIDVAKDTEGKYPTKRAAGEAITAFAESLQLPEPLIVMSGGGLHVYWPLDTDIPRAEWKPIATSLKNAARKSGLLIDPTRTADEASILRPVGTYNKKIIDKPREVVALDWTGQPSTLSTFSDLFKSEAYAAPSSVIFSMADAPLAIKQPNSLGVALADVGNIPKKFKPIAEKCHQIMWAITNMSGEAGVKISEPLWRSCVSIAVRCINGNAKVHALSAPYPGYTKTQTEEYYHREFGKNMPATCEQFAQARPEGCSNCRYAGKIKSPIVLGLEQVELEPPSVVVEAITVTAAPEVQHGFIISPSELRIAGVNPPKPYKRTDKGIVKIVSAPAVDADGVVIKGKFVQEDKYVSSMDIYPMFRTRETINGPDFVSYSSYWRMYPANQKESKHDILIQHSDLATDDGLKKLMYDKTMYTANTQEHKEVAEYMRSYMKQLGEKHTHPQPSHFGWQTPIDRTQTYANAAGEECTDYNQQPLEFVAGRSRYRRVCTDGKWAVALENDPVYPRTSMAMFADIMQPKGTLEGWSKAANWYKDSFASDYISIFLLATAAPFMRYTKDAGMVILARGDKGAGKSLLMSLVASVWGDPGKDAGYILGGNNTGNGLEPRAATLHNIPLLLDDKVEMARNALSDEIMMLANGASKNRGNWVGGRNESGATSTWCTNTLMTSNKSWIQILTSNKLDNEGETARLIEVTMSKIPKESWEIPGQRGENLYKAYVGGNSGLVGPLLIQEFHTDPNKYVQKMAIYEQLIIDTVVKAGLEGNSDIMGCEPQEYRLQAACAACGMLVLYMLRKRKLVEWSPDAFLASVVKIIAAVCRMTKDNRPSKADILSQYINEFHGNFIIVTSEGVKMMGDTGQSTQSFGRLPVSKIVGRIDHVDRLTSLDRASFKEWLNSRGLSEDATVKGLREEGWEVESGFKVRATLGRGFAATNKMQTRVIQLRNPMFNTKMENLL